MARILVADTCKDGGRISRVLAKEHQITVTAKLDNAVQFVHRNNIDLILCNVHFEESRMLDFLQWIKSTESTRKVPFLCYKDANTVLSSEGEHIADVVARELGACGYIDASDEHTLSDGELLKIVSRSLS